VLCERGVTLTEHGGTRKNFLHPLELVGRKVELLAHASEQRQTLLGKRGRFVLGPIAGRRTRVPIDRGFPASRAVKKRLAAAASAKPAAKS
jgi:hypothetical protein